MHPLLAAQTAHLQQYSRTCFQVHHLCQYEFFENVLIVSSITSWVFQLQSDLIRASLRIHSNRYSLDKSAVAGKITLFTANSDNFQGVVQTKVTLIRSIYLQLNS